MTEPIRVRVIMDGVEKWITLEELVELLAEYFQKRRGRKSEKSS